MLGRLRRDPLPLLVAACSVLLCVCAVASGGPAQLLGVLPPILLVIALACDLYPGEQVILRLSRRRRRHWLRATSMPARSRTIWPPVRRELRFLATCRRLRGPPPDLAF
jgi:hypothetical protein